MQDFTMDVRLCDDAGMISDAKVDPPNGFDADLTYLKQFRNLQSRTPGAKLYDGPPFGCTGHAHLAGEHIRCTSPAHAAAAHPADMLSDPMADLGIRGLGKGVILVPPPDAHAAEVALIVKATRARIPGANVAVLDIDPGPAIAYGTTHQMPPHAAPIESVSMTPIVRAAYDLAARGHSGQKYGREPYMSHCESVVCYLSDFGFYEEKDLLATGYLHDTLENTKVTRGEIIDATSPAVEALVFACTGIGTTRNERNNVIAKKLAMWPRAVPVRIADRLSNVVACWRTRDRRLFMYRDEHPAFRRAILDALAAEPELGRRCADMIVALDQLLGWGPQ